MTPLPATSEISATAGPAQRPKAVGSRRDLFATLVVSLPILAYLSSVWIIRPVSISPAVALLLLLAPLSIKVSRQYALRALRRVGFELSLLFLMIFLSVLSLTNSQEPFRSFRIIYPSALPLLIFGHLLVVGFLSRERLLQMPRLLILTGVLFSVTPFLVSMVAPPLQSYLFGYYRLQCFFENPIQHAIALAVLAPLIAAEFAICKSQSAKLGWSFLIVLMAYTMFRTGSKAPMFSGFAGATLLYVALKIRSQSLGRSFAMLLALFTCAGLLWIYGLDIAEKLNPVIADKMRSIIEGGISSYHSVQSRKLLWQEAIAQGREHWLVGSGAGGSVLGVSHAHNLIIDYFKGIGMFGALAIFLLCLSILFRMTTKGIWILRGFGDDSDRRILACYVAASIYVICNQMSDCFGPSTIGFLWIVYLTGILSERGLERAARNPGPPFDLRFHGAP